MSAADDDLEIWFQKRPKWMQDAARRIVEKGALIDQDYVELLNICLAEAKGEPIAFNGIPVGSLNVRESTKPLRLESISQVQGINALNPTKPLEFGEAGLCIVYGRNGAGKTGYVRLLKHACGARNPGDLLADIFKPGSQKQNAVLTFSQDGRTDSRQWSGNAIQELRGVDIYDTDEGLVYVNQENEVTFEPWILRLITELTTVCEILKRRIYSQIESLQSAKPDLPAEYGNTVASRWYDNIAHNTPTSSVDSNTRWESRDDAELTGIIKRLAEPDPAATATVLRRQRKTLDELVKDLDNWHKGLSDDHGRSLVQAKADAKAKRKAADEDAQQVFQKAPLTGIGTESWRLLWDAARKYSEELVYSGKTFPNISEGARCVLCQRELDQDSRDRFQFFEKFVKAELQEEAIKSQQNVEAIEITFPVVPNADVVTMRIDASGMTANPLRASVINFADQLLQRRESSLIAMNIGEITSLPSNAILEQMRELSVALEKQATTYDEDAEGQNRSELNARKRELLARQWLNQQRKAIEEEISRLAEIRKLKDADKLTNTQALSVHKSAMADELVTKAYIERFTNELGRLRAGRLSVELKKTKTQVGRVYHRIVLKDAATNAKTSDILSEGEFRIVSLAAFIADTEGRGSKTTFVFDDPISSLDQVYEEATAERLVNLSRDRQVIVFTHRLSLVHLLEKHSEKENVEEAVVSLSRIRTGEIADIPITLTSTKKTANRFLSERLAEVKAAYQSSDKEYEKVTKGLCTDIRILVEKIVEMDLLNGIVRRYVPDVQTKHKIGCLAKITDDDCKFIDRLMTNYSNYEHSQSDEAPVDLPKPDDIQEDLESIVAFIGRIKKRNED